MKTNTSATFCFLNQILTYLLCAGFISGCSGKSSQNKVNVIDNKVTTKKLIDIDDGAYWQEQVNYQSSTTLVTSKILTPEGHQLASSQLRETTLTPLNLPSNLNVNAFTVRSRGGIKTQEAVYIAPKLYLYRKSDKARVQVKQIGENVLIPLHAILVDGFSKEVPSSNGIDTVSLPDSYLINEDEVNKALISRGFKEPIALGPLDGCPKRFTLTVAGESYDITPASLSGSNQCELNRPFTLNLVVPKSKADFIVNEALYYNEVDVQASFEILVGYVESDTHIQLDRSKIYESLSASLVGKYPPYAKATVEANLKKIIQSETMNVFIKGDRNDIINQLFEAAYNSFVQPFDLTIPNFQSEVDCNDTSACVSVSYNKQNESRNLSIGYQQYSTTLTGQVISSFAKAQQILYPEVVLQSVTDDGMSINYISNLDENERDLMITINKGTILEFSLENMKKQIDNTEVKVTVNGELSCDSRDSFTKSCNRHTYRTSVTRTYDGPRFSENFSPAGNLSIPLSEQLYLRFKSPSGKITECSLAMLNANVNGNHIVVKLNSVHSRCNPFNKNDIENKNQYSVTFINKLVDDEALQVVNNGEKFSYTDHYSQQDSAPAYDATPLGGSKPSTVNSIKREMLLQLKITARKYDISN
ncbi:MAG: hypothetical protein ACK41T_05150 [Pseudobdellovibrio sp.]